MWQQVSTQLVSILKTINNKIYKLTHTNTSTVVASKYKNCKICQKGAEGDYWTAQFHLNKISIKDLCDYFSITRQEAWEHVNKHSPQPTTPFILDESSEEAKEFDYYMKLKRVAKALEKWINYLASQDVPTKDTVSQLSSLVKEYRHILMNLAEIEGKVQKGQVVVELKQYNEKLDEMITLIVEELCDDCRVKVLGKLETVLNV